MATDRIRAHVEEARYLLGCPTVFDVRNNFHFFWGEVESRYSFGERGKNVVQVLLYDLYKHGLVGIQSGLS
jgi:hypothetical protein